MAGVFKLGTRVKGGFPELKLSREPRLIIRNQKKKSLNVFRYVIVGSLLIVF